MEPREPEEPWEARESGEPGEAKKPGEPEEPGSDTKCSNRLQVNVLCNSKGP